MVLYILSNLKFTCNILKHLQTGLFYLSFLQKI